MQQVRVLMLVGLFALGLGVSSAALAEPQPLAWWPFEPGQPKPHVISDKISGWQDAISGNFKFMPGVVGQALRFDGYTTVVSRRPEDAPRVVDGLTIEAWVALEAYPWNDCPIASQARPGKQGYRLMVGSRGQVTLELAAGSKSSSQWVICKSEDWQVPLYKWVHVAGTFDAKAGLAIYVNGKKVAEQPASGRIDYAGGIDLRIGSRHQKAKPDHIHRPWGTLPTWWTLDGQLDELKVYGVALTAEQVAAHFRAQRPSSDPVMPPRRLPSGPKGPGRFGAYYTTLKFYEQWDDLWRVGPDADVLVRFDTSPVRVVFWRGSRYSPAWVSDNELWMADQSVEAWGTGRNDLEGCFEHMQDRHCRYSHVRIIESNPARVVVHWRYAPVSAYDHIWNIDPRTGKGCWVDEYYTIYPDAMGIRKVTWQTGTLGHPRQFQESLPFTHPRQLISQVIHKDYAYVVNMDGQVGTCSYHNSREEAAKVTYPPNTLAQQYNFKSKYKPFIVYEVGTRMNCRERVLGPRGMDVPGSCNHWPVGQAACDGRTVQAPDRPTHFCGFPISYPPIHEDGKRSWWAGWYGMADLEPQQLADIIRAFNFAPKVRVLGDGFTCRGYDKGQRAFVLVNEGPTDRPLKLRLEADEEHPLYHPALVVRNWGQSQVQVTIDGNRRKPGPTWRAGHRHHPDSSDLIVWMNCKTRRPVEIVIEPLKPAGR